MKRFNFLLSNRFWALIIAALAVVSQEGFTSEAWTKGVLMVVTGFIGIRTIDRAAEKSGSTDTK